MQEVRQLRLKLAEVEKENDFLKKAAAYRFIEKHQRSFGTRWLLKRMGIYPNAYYNYLKQAKSGYYARKKEICHKIKDIYHEFGGILGYRSMRVFLARKQIF